MIEVVDARGVRVRLDGPPARIVSLVPSTTETLHALCPDRVVGRTRFCVRPRPWVDGIARVGGTKDVDPARVDALAPDLVVGNVEENTPAIFAAIEARHPLWAAFPRTVDEALDDLGRLGLLVGGADRAAAIRRDLDARRARLEAAARPFTYAYLIWRGPWMAAGPDTFIASMLGLAGGTNVVTAPRYPEVSPAALRDADVVLLSSEPFPFRDRHRAELVAEGLARVRFVDGQLCSWHGVRMGAAFDALAGWVRDGFPAHA